MKNKKGFTLIELLAVIVILAIIALIAVPIILNMINNARKSAAKSSLLGYVDSIESYSGFRAISDDAELTGYDVDLPAMTNGKVTCTKTSSGWNSECEDFFNAVDQKAKGKKPDTATVIISEEGKVLDGTKMKFNGYEVTYDGKDASVDGSSNNNNNSGSGSNQQSENTTTNYFATDSWATIAANTTSDRYKVGDTKCVALTGFTTTNNNGCSNGEFKVRIANKSACTNGETSQTACGFVVEFADIIAKRNMNPKGEYDGVQYDKGYSKGGYPASALYNEYFAINATNSLYAALPSELQNVIIDTIVISGHEYGKTDNYTSTDKLYLLATKELGYNVKNDSAKDETKILDYYITHNTEDDIIKQSNGIDSKFWWLRSAASNVTSAFYETYNARDGISYGSNSIYGVSPAFRIGTN